MENTKSYTGLFIIIPEKHDSIEDVTGSINSIIKEHSGTVDKENMMGKRSLAYPIKKRSEGVYYEITFSAEPEAITKMMRQFRINTDILRTLIDANK